jgi:hypothetical protein
MVGVSLEGALQRPDAAFEFVEMDLNCNGSCRTGFLFLSSNIRHVSFGIIGFLPRIPDCRRERRANELTKGHRRSQSDAVDVGTDTESATSFKLCVGLRLSQA